LKGFFTKGTYPSFLAFWLKLPLRRLILSPGKLAARLNLEKTFRVLEIGPGPGYFSIEVAKHLTEGHLELLDIQKDMLEKARKRIAASGLDNVGFICGDASELPFKENSFDVVFLVAVLGEVSAPEACIKSIYRVLKPGGLLSITEQPGDPDFVPSHTVRSLVEKQGFKFVKFYGKNKNYTVNFRKFPAIAT